MSFIQSVNKISFNTIASASQQAARNWDHIPASHIEEFKESMAKNPKETDHADVYAEEFHSYFFSNRDGRIWLYVDTRYVAMDEIDAMRCAANLIRQCGGKASETKTKSILFLLKQFAQEVPPAANGINLSNGFLEFTGAGWQFVPHCLSHGQCMVLPCDFDPVEVAARWLQFLNRVQPDPELQEYLQDLYGYILLGKNRPHEECFATWLGNGANGKSVALGVMKMLIGAENCSHLSMHEFTSRNIEDLNGKLVNLGSEVEVGSKAQTAVLKKLSSREELRAEPKYRDHFPFISSAVAVFAVNAMPKIDDTSDGIGRRMHLLTWDVTIPEAERDHHLQKNLEAELPGILNWAIIGAQRVLQRGLKVPNQIRDAVKRQRKEANSVAMFCQEVVVKEAGTCVSKDDLYQAYGIWCRKSGSKAMSQICFAKELKRLMPELSESKSRVGYVNLQGRTLQSRVNVWSSLYIPAERLERQVSSTSHIVSGAIGSVEATAASNDEFSAAQAA